MPAPNTAHVEPGATFAVLIAAPSPVERPQANRHARSSGASGSTFASAISGMTVYSANVDVPMKWRIGSPSRDEPRRAVRQVALVLLLADGEAEVRAVVVAVDALAALRREERDDVVARRDVAHAFADTLDDAGTLVAEHGRRVAGRVGAGGGVEVGVADAAGDEPHQHLACLRLGEVELLHLERCTELLEDGRADLHRADSTRTGLIVPRA